MVRQGELMPDWLDSWTNTRRLSQQDLARRWANRGEPEQVAPIKQATAVSTPLPFAHTKYILNHGTKAYRQWLADGCPGPGQ